MSYWQNREIDELNSLYDATLSDIEDEIAKQYELTFKAVLKEMTDFWNYVQAQDKDKILVSDLYKLVRYYQLLDQINNELSGMSRKTIKIMNKRMKRFAVNYSKKLIDTYNLNTKLDTKAAESVVCKVWANDGQNYSDRIWTNKAKLVTVLEQGLFRIVSTGSSTVELEREIANTFNVNYKVAKRLVRTELSYLQNKLALDRYKDSNIEQYKYLTLRDDKVCTICKALDQQIFDISKAQFGVNVPPLHPNCRCLIAPVVKV